MSSESDFLAFKGLKKYTPDDGWHQVNAILKSTELADELEEIQQEETSLAQELQLLTPSHSTETTSVTVVSDDAGVPAFAPLIDDLLEQLNRAPVDDLTQEWRMVASEFNVLNQHIALRRDLQARMHQTEEDIRALRHAISERLAGAQEAANRQLENARLRAEVSALVQAKIATKLHQ